MVGLLVLLFAVAMHAGVFASGPGPEHHSLDHQSVVVTPANAYAASGDHGFVHGVMHGCVFILSAAVFAFGLALLHGLLNNGLPGGHLPISRRWRMRRERPPPWTVLPIPRI